MEMKLYDDWFKFIRSGDMEPFDAAVLSVQLAQKGLECREENYEEVVKLLDSIPGEGAEEKGPFKAVSVVEDAIVYEKTFERPEDAVRQIAEWAGEYEDGTWKNSIVDGEGKTILTISQEVWEEKA